MKPLTTGPNPNVARAIERATQNDPRHVVSERDAKAIAKVVAQELALVAPQDQERALASIGLALAEAPRPDRYKPAAGVLNALAARVASTHAMPAFPPDGKTADFEALTSAVVSALKQSFSFKRKNGGKDILWTGPENLQRIAAGSPPFAEQINIEGLAYHRERGRDALTMLVTILVQLGLEQGVRLASSGANVASLKQGVIARAQGDANAPTIDALKELLAGVEQGDFGAPASKRAALPGAGEMIARGGLPFDESALLAPLKDALTFAFDITPKGRDKLDAALTRMLAVGVEQGRRMAREEIERDLFGVSTLLVLLESGHASPELVKMYLSRLTEP